MQDCIVIQQNKIRYHYNMDIPYSAEYTRRREQQKFQRGACIQV